MATSPNVHAHAKSDEPDDDVPMPPDDPGRQPPVEEPPKKDPPKRVQLPNDYEWGVTCELEKSSKIIRAGSWSVCRIEACSSR